MLKISLPFKKNTNFTGELVYLLRKIQTLRVNNSRIFTNKNAKFSGYYTFMTLNMWGDFQICISVPLWLLTIFEKSFSNN